MDSLQPPTLSTTRKRKRPDKVRHARLYNFAREALRNPIVAPQPHLEMCRFLDYGIRDIAHCGTPRAKQTKQLLLVPRGCGKTAMGVALSLHVLRNFPNYRILFDGNKHENSIERLSAAKFELEFNDHFRDCYGDLVSEAPIWRETKITLNSRTQSLKEPSIDTAGIDRAKTGGHYELIVADDLVNELNVNSEGMRQKTITHIQSLYPLLAPGGTLLVIGTRWAENDAYSWIIKKDLELEKKGEDPSYLKMIRGAVNPDGSLYAPTLLGDEQLAQHRKDLDPWMFSCQFLNQTLTESSQIFPSSIIRTFEGEYRLGDEPYLEMNVLV